MSELVKNYRKNDDLRQSFNNLAKVTFGLDFEDWYQNGYWGENYIPYSIVEDGVVVANVSVNITDMAWKGSKKHLIQLGTVMTAESYRNQGLIRRIMEEIEKDFGQDVDGIYLFANDEVLDFYPKFGFRKAAEYKYSKQVSNEEAGTMVPISMKNKVEWSVLVDAINKSIPCGAFEMVGNSDLFLFYVTKFMQENVYYDKKSDVYVIAEIEDGELLLHNVFSEKKVNLEDIILAFGKDIKKVTLGFTPESKEGYEQEEVQEEDTTLFVKGDIFAEFENEQIMFPTLAHA